MIQKLKSKIGLVLGGGYLLLVALMILASLVSKPDAMTILAPLTLTAPWSFLLLALGDGPIEKVPEGSLSVIGPLAFLAILTISALCNAAILYGIGLLFDLTMRSHDREVKLK